MRSPFSIPFARKSRAPRITARPLPPSDVATARCFTVPAHTRDEAWAQGWRVPAHSLRPEPEQGRSRGARHRQIRRERTESRPGQAAAAPAPALPCAYAQGRGPPELQGGGVAGVPRGCEWRSARAAGEAGPRSTLAQRAGPHGEGARRHVEPARRPSVEAGALCARDRCARGGRGDRRCAERGANRNPKPNPDPSPNPNLNSSPNPDPNPDPDPDPDPNPNPNPNPNQVR